VSTSRPKTIALVARPLGLRGATVATFDYADANETILGNRSIILFDDLAENDPGAVERFRRRFPLAVCRQTDDLDRVLQREKADLVYILKMGSPDGWASCALPTAIHAAFQTWPTDAHGTAYAYVSRWLARVFTSGVAPWVPHIVRLPDTNGNRRKELAIPKDALVLGCHGGADSFDIPFARRAVEQALARRRDLWFAFLNINPFVDHERALFLSGTADPIAKTEFINTCDAMLHARGRGETLGLAVAEFSVRGRPVLTWGGSMERAHLDMLGDAALVYRDERGLLRRLLFGRLGALRRGAFAFGFGARPFRPRRRRQPRAIDRVALEHFDRLRHLADFVAAVLPGDLDLDVAFRQLVILAFSSVSGRATLTVDSHTAAAPASKAATRATSAIVIKASRDSARRSAAACVFSSRRVWLNARRSSIRLRSEASSASISRAPSAIASSSSGFNFEPASREGVFTPILKGFRA